jgi:predicted transcriptional regulator YdeE
VNQVNWGFEARDGSTLVSWEMNGSMPFLFRFMAPRMAPTIERDYELGLALLSGYMNPASPHPEVEFIGREELEAFNYWSIPCNGNLRQLEKARRSSIETLQAIGVDKVGLALTLYHQFDPMASQYQAEVAVPVGNSTPLSNYKRHEFKGGVYFKMTLRGDLGFLPLGWYALHSHCRMHKIKLDNTRPALEIYLGDATRITDGNQFSTDLYIPVL